MNIAEVSKKFNLTPDTLRYYEKVGLIPKVNRTAGGNRDYSEHDCDWISFIKCMRGAGVQVEALVEYVRLFEQGEATAGARLQILLRERERITTQVYEMQCTLERLNKKIERYEQDIVSAENDLTLALRRE